MTTKPDKIPFTPPVNGDADFNTQANDALASLPSLVDFADESNDYQTTVFEAPTSTSILSDESGLTDRTRLVPLRLNDAGTALTPVLESTYSDGGEIVQFKGLSANLADSVNGFRRTRGRSITASESVMGDSLIHYIGQDTDGGTIRVYRSSVVYSSLDRAITTTTDIAEFDTIVEAMAIGNGYLATNPGHPNHISRTVQSVPAEARVPASATLNFTGWLYDAQVQTGSAYNFFAS